MTPELIEIHAHRPQSVRDGRHLRTLHSSFWRWFSLVQQYIDVEYGLACHARRNILPNVYVASRLNLKFLLRTRSDYLEQVGWCATPCSQRNFFSVSTSRSLSQQPKKRHLCQTFPRKMRCGTQRQLTIVPSYPHASILWRWGWPFPLYLFLSGSHLPNHDYLPAPCVF